MVALWENDVSRVFSIAIFVYFAFAILSANTISKRIQALVSTAPGAMTSLGILGTFFGIFVGLLDFDIRAIDRSVPDLLEGLKVAFGTSILGLFAAVTYRIANPLITRAKVQQENATVEDIVLQLQQLNEKVDAAGVDNTRHLQELRDALTDDKDTSLVGQMQRLRGAVSDLEASLRKGFDEQISEFKNFAEQMSKAFSEAIIDELKAVIREFNEKISEQFGENFKQLNLAVGRLVDWQEQYRQQMDELMSAMDAAVLGLQGARDSLHEIEKSASNIPQSVAQMREANDLLGAQLEELLGHLGSFAEIREKAVSAFPEIQANIEQLTSNLQSAAADQSKAIKAMTGEGEALVSNMRNASESISLGFDDLRARTEATVTDVSEQVLRITKEMAHATESAGREVHSMVQDSMAEQRQTQREMLDGLQTSFNDTISSATKQMNEAIVQLDQAMQDEIESVVRSMAENLSGVSEKFVADYNPLLANMRRIVEMSEEAKRHV